ncbi:hypothetical protein [Paenibacillus naphthalenovorans]|uniref:hypothetical protein n=1 Tax=Paenibacillus naphthalenovorans TaxID=162209 RepID=UPI003D28CF88
MSTMQIVISACTGFVALLSLIFNIYQYYQNGKLKEKVEERDERLRANEMFAKIRTKRESFEEELAELTCLTDDDSKSVKKKQFLKVYKKYVALFDEIEDFCTKISDKVIDSENYIRNTVLPTLNSLTELQLEVFGILNDYALSNEFERLRKPDYGAFSEFDRFLLKYNDGEGSHFWRKIKTLRRDYEFE